MFREQLLMSDQETKIETNVSLDDLIKKEKRREIRKRYYKKNRDTILAKSKKKYNEIRKVKADVIIPIVVLEH